MGITLTALADGTVMDASVVTARFTTIQTWQNGGIVTADIAQGTIPSRAFRRIDQYPLRSAGVTGGCHRETVTDDPLSRAYATMDSHGTLIWQDVSCMEAILYAEDAGKIEVVFEWWAWATQSDRTPATVPAGPEAFKSVDFRLAVNGTGQADTVISLQDAGTDPVGSSDGGPFCYPARNFQALYSGSVTPGVTAVTLQVRIEDHGTATATSDRNKYSLNIIGARQPHLEYWRL